MNIKKTGSPVSEDLTDFTALELTDYYRKICSSLGLDPVTKPLEYRVLNGKLLLFRKRNSTDPRIVMLSRES